MDSDAGAVLAFWFGEATAQQWFAKDDAFDATIRERFGALHRRLSREVPAQWLADPASQLAAVIVLDQFSRNLHRGSPAAYAQDEAALALARMAVARGDDGPLQPSERHFLYMPFMHSENLADQDECVRLMGGLGLGEALDAARRHRAIIARFGRFPHRNAALGRETTPEEETFLKEPGSSF